MAGACPDTRANNYAVSSLNIVNKCGDGITAVDTATCNDVINKGAPKLCNAAPCCQLSLNRQSCISACQGIPQLLFSRRLSTEL